MAVYAVMHGGALGIDIEYVRPIPEIDEIATAFFRSRNVPYSTRYRLTSGATASSGAGQEKKHISRQLATVLQYASTSSR
jgi:hypothetical protein